MRLTNAALRRLIKKPGYHCENGGLYFRVLPGEKGYWVFRYQGADGKRHAMSLGVHPIVGPDEARAARDAARLKLKIERIDPLRDKRAGKQARVPTFGKAADTYIAAHERSWKTAAYRVQWKTTLATYCAPIRDTPVNEIDTEAVLRVLQPIWTRKPAVASMLRGRIETMIDAARALGHIVPDRANPARWRGHLDKLLPAPSKVRKVEHHAAMPYGNLPRFMTQLRSTEGPAAKALALVILCSSRRSEVLNMTWDEVDLDAKLWTVPGERMKVGVEHIVPLPDAAVAILREQGAKRHPKQPHVFPGARPGRPLSEATFKRTMRRLGASAYTAHGFRSSFRDWAGDHAIEFEVAEQCLAHTVGNGVTRAYLRTTILERRRKVMADWAAFLAGEAAASTVIASARREASRHNRRTIVKMGELPDANRGSLISREI